MNKTKIKGAITLFLAAIIWGVAFVAQSEGMRYLGPYAFNAIRFMLGGIVLLPFIYIRGRSNKANTYNKEVTSEKSNEKSAIRSWIEKEKNLIVGGLCCGTILCVANGFQQIGIQSTSVGKAGFITTLYIILVPIIGIFLKKKPPISIWFSVLMAMFGLYLLCINDSSTLNKGDGFLLICALLFSVHILVIDFFSPKVDGVKLSCFQFFVSGFLCTILTILFEKVTLQAVIDCSIPILYAGIMSCGVAYTFQIIGQKHMDPAVASLILSLESVVAVLSGWIILGQVLTLREMIGCGIVFVAVILAQIPRKVKRNKISILEEELEKTA